MLKKLKPGVFEFPPVHFLIKDGWIRVQAEGVTVLPPGEFNDNRDEGEGDLVAFVGEEEVGRAWFMFRHHSEDQSGNVDPASPAATSIHLEVERAWWRRGIAIALYRYGNMVAGRLGEKLELFGESPESSAVWEKMVKLGLTSKGNRWVMAPEKFPR